MRLRGKLPDHRARTGWFPAAWQVIAMAAGIGTIVAALLFHHGIDIVLCLAVLLSAATPTFVRLRRGDFDIFEPTFGAGLMLAILFGIRPLYIVAQGRYDYLGYNTEPQLTAVIGLGLVATLSFMAGYGGLRRKRREDGSPKSQVNESRDLAELRRSVTWVALLVSALGLALFAINLLRMGPLTKVIPLWLGGQSSALNSGNVGTSEYLYSAPILVACAAIAIGVVFSWRLSRLQIVGVAALAILPAVVFFINGDRRYLLPCILVPIVAYCLSTGRRPSGKLILVLVPLAFLVLVTIPWLRTAASRSYYGGVPAIISNNFTRPLTAWNEFITGNDTEMESALSVQLQVQGGPLDFYYGRATIGDLLLAPIPSAVFPGKPETARNDMLIRIFGEPCNAIIGHQCPDFSAVGTFYQDLWWPGVMVGMTALGAFSGAVWRWRRALPNSPYSVVTAATWTVILPILIRAGFMPAFAWWLYFLVPTFAIIALSRVIANRPHSSSTRLSPMDNKVGP
jgi:hypothetical protein